MIKAIDPCVSNAIKYLKTESCGHSPVITSPLYRLKFEAEFNCYLKHGNDHFYLEFATEQDELFFRIKFA